MKVSTGLFQWLARRAPNAVELWYPKNCLKDGPNGALARLHAAGLHIACVSTPSSLYGPDSGGSVQLLETAVMLAQRTGATRVNTYFGHAPEVDDARAVELYVRAVSPLLRCAEATGAVIVLENEFDAFSWDPAGSDVTRRPESLAALCQRLDHPAFGLTFDAANFYCASVDPVQQALPALRAWIRYAHVKDVVRAGSDTTPTPGWVRYADHGRAYDTAPLGSGGVNWPTILDDLTTAGYDGYFTLEPHCDRSLLLAETARAADWLRAQAALSAQHGHSSEA